MARESNPINNLNKWNLATTVWTPYEHKRKKGRPAMRWIDEIKRTTGPQWTRAAQNRVSWRKVVEAHALRWAD